MNVSFTSIDVAALSPLLMVLAGALGFLLLETFHPEWIKKQFLPYSLGILGLSLGASFFAPPSSHSLLTPWIQFDVLARWFNLFFLWIGVALVLMAPPFFERFSLRCGEFGFLLFSALFGLMLIGSSADFLLLFLGIETLSLSLYVLCCYVKGESLASESSIKYFLLGALTAAFLTYGIALIYGALGTTRLDALFVPLSGELPQSLFYGGLSLVLVGLCFEAAIVPFHTWAPDVYEGASTPVTAFMAVGTKVGAFAAFLRVFFGVFQAEALLNGMVFALLAYPTLLYANFLALRQIQLRRFFAYSGISHAGFLLIPMAAGTPDAQSALLFYLVVYALATLLAFSVIMVLDDKPEGITIHDLRGLFYRSPVSASILALSFLTLAGIPPTVGFTAKFAILYAGFQAGYVTLVIVGLLTTVLSAVYYLRFVGAMFQEPVSAKALPRIPSIEFLSAVTAALLVLGSFFPEPFFRFLSP